MSVEAIRPDGEASRSSKVDGLRGGWSQIAVVRRWLSLGMMVAIVLGLGAASAWAAPNDTVLVSRSSGADAPAASAGSIGSSISGDGRFVAFVSDAANVSSDDPDAFRDVFVRDLQTNTTTLVDRATGPAGAKGNDRADDPAISADGRFVAFTSRATNLVPSDTNGTDDVFVRDRQSDTTTRVSVATDGTQADSYSRPPEISADGRFVVFGSNAANLVAGDTNGAEDVFVRDLQTDTTTRVSVASDGTQGGPGRGSGVAPAISADGRFVSFGTGAPLVAEDTNNGGDVYVRDQQTNTTARVSVASDGSQATQIGGMFASSGPSSISGDGRFVAFGSAGNNLTPNDTNDRVDVFVKDLQTNAITLVSRASGDDPNANFDSSLRSRSISADGRLVAFESFASNVVAGDRNNAVDVFVRDVQAGVTTVVSRSSGAGPPDGTGGDAGAPSMSADGRFVSFGSGATNLVAGDTNRSADIFRRELGPPPVQPPPGDQPPGNQPPATQPPGVMPPGVTPLGVMPPVARPGGDKTITGTPGNDRLVGTPGDDTITCGGGDDVVIAGGGDDVINCGAGNDRIDSGAGDDRVSGGSGNDRVTGGAGGDRLSGGRGRDRVSGNSGNDRLLGNSGRDSLSGGSGRDVLIGGSGRDRLNGGPGKDRQRQ